MKGRETIKSAPSADLLVCLPSWANLALRPMPVCGPGMLPDTGNCCHLEQRPHLKRLVTRVGQASPLFLAEPNHMGLETAEPTSPKVTCSGQIKIRPTARPCKSWQSMMEDIERIHSSQKNKRPAWFESISVLKKDVMQFLTCLWSLRFDLRCFGTFPKSEVGTDYEDEDGRCREGAVQANYDESTSRTIFSKWFMVLQENQNYEFYRKDGVDGGKSSDGFPIAPPSNALLLMRCRSAPVNRWPVSGGIGGERVRDNSDGRESSNRAIIEGRSRKLGLLMNEVEKSEEGSHQFTRIT